MGVETTEGGTTMKEKEKEKYYSFFKLNNLAKIINLKYLKNYNFWHNFKYPCCVLGLT